MTKIRLKKLMTVTADTNVVVIELDAFSSLNVYRKYLKEKLVKLLFLVII